MLTGDERRRLAEIEFMVQVADPRLANTLKRFGRPVIPWRVIAVIVGGGWVVDLLLLSTGRFIIAMFLLTPLTAATAIWWAERA